MLIDTHLPAALLVLASLLGSAFGQQETTSLLFLLCPGETGTIECPTPQNQTSCLFEVTDFAYYLYAWGLQASNGGQIFTPTQCLLDAACSLSCPTECSCAVEGSSGSTCDGAACTADASSSLPPTPLPATTTLSPSLPVSTDTNATTTTPFRLCKGETGTFLCPTPAETRVCEFTSNDFWYWNYSRQVTTDVDTGAILSGTQELITHNCRYFEDSSSASCQVQCPVICSCQTDQGGDCTAVECTSFDGDTSPTPLPAAASPTPLPVLDTSTTTQFLLCSGESGNFTCPTPEKTPLCTFDTNDYSFWNFSYSSSTDDETSVTIGSQELLTQTCSSLAAIQQGSPCVVECPVDCTCQTAEGEECSGLACGGSDSGSPPSSAIPVLEEPSTETTNTTGEEQDVAIGPPPSSSIPVFGEDEPVTASDTSTNDTAAATTAPSTTTPPAAADGATPPSSGAIAARCWTGEIGNMIGGLAVAFLLLVV